MPQKLNKAGKMQDYIPAGNGDPSGEYGTSKGTNKNFTTSDKKSSKANVITENKSVSVGNRMAKKYDMPISKFDEVIDSYTKTEKELREKGKNEDADWYKKQIEKEKKFKEEAIEARKGKDNKANIINDDLTGKGNSIQEAYNLLNSDNIESIEYEMNWKNTSSGRDNLTFNKKLDDKNKFLNMLDATYGSKKQLEKNLAFSHQTNYLILKVKEKGHRAKEVKLSYEDLIKLNNKITGKRTKQ